VNEATPNIEGAIWILNHIIQEKYKEGEARDWKEYAEEMRDTYVNVRKLIQSLIVTYIYIYIYIYIYSWLAYYYYFQAMIDVVALYLDYELSKAVLMETPKVSWNDTNVDPISSLRSLIPGEYKEDKLVSNAWEKHFFRLPSVVGDVSWVNQTQVNPLI
jgi:hypothetical protein